MMLIEAIFIAFALCFTEWVCTYREDVYTIYNIIMKENNYEL